MHPPIGLEQYSAAPDISASRQEEILSELKQNEKYSRGAVPGSVGVLTFKDNDPRTGLGLAATEFFTANLALFNRFTLIDLSYSEVLEAEYRTYSPAQKRAILQAEQLVSGDVVLENGRLQIYGTLASQRSRSVSPLGDLRGGVRDFFRLIADLNIKFLEDNNITVTSQIANELYKVPTENLVAYIFYARGRHHERMGDYQEAAEAYRAAIVKDPKFKEAQKGLKDAERQMSQVPAPQNAQANRDVLSDAPDTAPNILEELSTPGLPGNSPVIIDVQLPQVP
jgi:tetratricopeptide (TPR) repeat protein